MRTEVKANWSICSGKTTVCTNRAQRHPTYNSFTSACVCVVCAPCVRWSIFAWRFLYAMRHSNATVTSPVIEAHFVFNLLVYYINNSCIVFPVRCSVCCPVPYTYGTRATETTYSCVPRMALAKGIYIWHNTNLNERD